MSRYDLISSLSFIQPGALRTPSCLWRGCRESWRKWRGGLHLLQHTDSNTKTASKWGSINGFIFFTESLLMTYRIILWWIILLHGTLTLHWHFQTFNTQVNDQDPETPLFGLAKILDIPKALTLCESTADELSRRIRNTCAEGLRIHTCQKWMNSNATTNFAKKIQCWCQLCL